MEKSYLIDFYIFFQNGICQYLSNDIKSGPIHPIFRRKDWATYFDNSEHYNFTNRRGNDLLNVTNQSLCIRILD